MRRGHSVIGVDRDTEARGFIQQCIEHRPRSVGIGKQFTVFFFVQADAQLFLEECRGALGWKRAQHIPDDARRAAPEIALGDFPVRDVAARAAADQNLGADATRAVQAAHTQMRRGPGGEDRRRQASGPCTDHHEIASRVRGHIPHNT